MLLKHDMDTDLDSTTFLIFQSFGSLLNQIDSLERHWARERFFRVGECMRVMFNSLRRSGQHDNIRYLVRRSFIRMRYILFETFSNLFAVNKQGGDTVEDISKMMGDLDFDDNLDDDVDDVDDIDGNDSKEAKEDSVVGKSVTFDDDVPNAPTSNVVEKIDAPVANETEKNGDENPFDKLKKKKKKKKKKAYVPDLS